MKGKTNTSGKGYLFAVPASLGIPPDPLRMRLDIHEQAVVMSTFNKGGGAVKVVSAADVARALAGEMSWSSGILPPDAIWWSNTAAGPVVAVYQEPRMRRVALKKSSAAGEQPRRLNVPMPGLIFLCAPATEPYVYAVKKRPVTLEAEVFNAPLCNVFESGRTCPGTHKYPPDIAGIPDSFFQAFFTESADLDKRSRKYPENVVQLWNHIEGKDKFPLDDLVYFGTVKDLMAMELDR